jgi:hypothetical protein
MSRMNVGERQALRQVVRQRMKVLRSDVAARKAELQTGVEEQVHARFAATDKLIEDLNDRLASIVDQANKDIRVLVETAGRDQHASLGLTSLIPAPRVGYTQNEQGVYRRQLHADIEAKCALALVEIDRMEADLLTELTVDGLETDVPHPHRRRTGAGQPDQGAGTVSRHVDPPANSHGINAVTHLMLAIVYATIGYAGLGAHPGDYLPWLNPPLFVGGAGTLLCLVLMRGDLHSRRIDARLRQRVRYEVARADYADAELKRLRGIVYGIPKPRNEQRS